MFLRIELLFDLIQSFINLDPTNMLHAIQTIYSSKLTEGKLYTQSDCSLAQYYYAVIQIQVNRSSYYNIISNATFSAKGYIYEEYFDVFNPMTNLLKEIHTSTCYDNFDITVDLRVNTRYVLVVTTNYPLHTGPFSVLVTGLYNVSLIHLRE